MIYSVKALSSARWLWLCLTVTALVLEGLALYFQYGLNLQPCIKCIYIRCAVAGIAVAGLIGALSPKSGFIRLIALLGWLAAAIFGMWQSAELLEIEKIIAEGGFSTCPLFADFPAWLALDKWLPAVFEPTGSCGAIDWTFLDKSMAFWTWLTMWAYIIVAVIVLLAQPFKKNPNPYM